LTKESGVKKAEREGKTGSKNVKKDKFKEKW
jgi:hypothetical protein